MREYFFTHFGPFAGTPPLGDRSEFWLAGSYRRRNHPCQILWQSVQGVWSADTPLFALLHRNSWSPLQQCRHYRATLWFVQPSGVNASIVFLDIRCMISLQISGEARPTNYQASVQTVISVDLDEILFIGKPIVIYSVRNYLPLEVDVDDSSDWWSSSHHKL